MVRTADLAHWVLISSTDLRGRSPIIVEARHVIVRPGKEGHAT